MNDSVRRSARGKVSNRGGFTIAEMLIAVIILLLAVTSISAVARLAMKNYRDQVRRSNAELLCAALSSSVRNELVFAGDISEEDGAITFDSYAHRLMGCRLMVCDQNSGAYFDPADGFDASGRLDLRQAEANPDFPMFNAAYDLPLADDAMYGSGADAVRASLALFWDEQEEHFDARIAIWDAQGEELCSDAFTVRPISPG